MLQAWSECSTILSRVKTTRFQNGIIGSVWIPQGAEPEAELMCLHFITVYSSGASRERKGRRRSPQEDVLSNRALLSGGLNPKGYTLEKP